MRHLTVRNVPPDLASALETEKHRREQSLNQLIIDLLRQILGVGPGQKRSNGLARLAGTWTAAEHSSFEAAIASIQQIDEEHWS